MSTIKIIRIITRLNIGGPSVHVGLLSSRLDPLRFETVLVSGRSAPDEGDLGETMQKQGVRLLRIPNLRRQLNPFRDLLAFAALWRILWREQPRIIHTHMAKAGTLGRLVGILYNAVGPGRRHRAMLIHTFHGHVLEGYFPLWLSHLFVIIERWLASKTHYLIAVSEAIKRQLLEKKIGYATQWRVIPLGLELEALGELPLPAERSTMRVGMVGRLVPIKNPLLFLTALRQIQECHPGLIEQGVIVGDGPLRPVLEKETERLGLSGLLRFDGWKQDLCSVYREFDITCLTSWNEGTPVSLIEAMAAGRAVLATDVGGVRDVLANDGEVQTKISPGTYQVTKRGVLVRPGDEDALAAALKKLSTDAALRRLLGETARRYVLNSFGASRLIENMTKLYEALLREAACAS
ncbi:MAG: glycosyltransferase family 4 protein [Candidatus Omnitrophica bacterium]|nr:glycosyltransferase family 4 protein [Candidatus Omnitrophota bacterium]